MTKGFHKKADTGHIHIVLKRYLLEWIEKKAEDLKTSRSAEIEKCILVAWLNEQQRK